MTAEQFTYWLQGYSEMSGINGHPTIDQWRVIQGHLKEVFRKNTPNYYDVRPNQMPVPNTLPNTLPNQPFSNTSTFI